MPERRFVRFLLKQRFVYRTASGNVLPYGINALSNNLIMVDRKLLKNPNGLILGTPGSGKSFSAKREIANCFLLTTDDVILPNAPSCWEPSVCPTMRSRPMQEPKWSPILFSCKSGTARLTFRRNGHRPAKPRTALLSTAISWITRKWCWAAPPQKTLNTANRTILPPQQGMGQDHSQLQLRYCPPWLCAEQPPGCAGWLH